MYERLGTIEREEGTAPGAFRGTLATGGEASDGHILAIGGLKIPDSLPVQFRHGERTLGSWSDFEKVNPKDIGSPGSRLRATANVELDAGAGEELAFRQDLAAMIGEGHVGAFSLRWDADEADVKLRINLPSDHPAFLDQDKIPNGDRRFWGLFFEKSVAIEGSIVATPSDQGALIGRIRSADCDPVARKEYREAILDSILEPEEMEGMIRVELRDGTELFLRPAAYEELLGFASERLRYALELQGTRDQYAPPKVAISHAQSAEQINPATVLREELGSLRAELKRERDDAIQRFLGREATP